MLTNYPQAVANIHKELKAYLKQHSGIQTLVLGLSGGIDSALSAALARPVCDELGIKLMGRSITISTNKPDEISRAEAIGNAFCHDFAHVDLSAYFGKIAETVMEGFFEEDTRDINFKIRLGNVKARTRMMYLYNLAGKHKGMVLSTDNYTEYLLGFWTLHGDVGDYGMVQNLWKTEVYGIARHLVNEATNSSKQDALLRCVEALPTDGLGITATDLDQIGGNSYDEVDEALLQIIDGKELPDSDFYNKVLQRHQASAHKRSNPFNIPRARITGQ